MAEIRKRLILFRYLSTILTNRCESMTVWRMTLKPLRRVVTVRSEFPVSMAAVCPPTTHLLEWLAISLTPGLGPTTARKLVEHLGSAEAVWRALLTELESTGIQAVSAIAGHGKAGGTGTETDCAHSRPHSRWNVDRGSTWKPRNRPVGVLLLVARWNRIGTFSPCLATSLTRIPRGPNTLIRQGAKPVAAWKNVWQNPRRR
jgi:hypothetical protein